MSDEFESKMLPIQTNFALLTEQQIQESKVLNDKILLVEQ